MKRQPSEVFAVRPPRGMMLPVLLLLMATVMPPARSQTTAEDPLLRQPPVVAPLQTMASSGQPQAAVDQSLTRMTTLFNILLGILIVLLGATIGSLWLLRHAVIQEIATRAKEQLEGLQELESQIAKTRENAKAILDEMEAIADDAADDADQFQQDIAKERDTLSRLVAELAQSKTQMIAELEAQLVTSRQ